MVFIFCYLNKSCIFVQKNFNFMKKVIFIFTLMLSLTTTVDKATNVMTNNIPEMVLIYDEIWGTIYHPVKEQCNNQPTITGDGSSIIPENASEHRWIAISQVMLWCDYRQKLISKDDNRFKGRLKYGDYVWIDSPHSEINGWWEVRDTKNKRYTNSIDFLQTVGDYKLYNDNKLWSGKFNNIKIYKFVEN